MLFRLLTARQASPTTQCHLSSSHRRLNRARKSRFCRKTHIFSKNAGHPQDGVNLLSSSGATAAPHAMSPSNSPQISDQTFKASCTTLLVTFRKCVKGSPSRYFAMGSPGSTWDDGTRAIVCDSSPSNRTNLMPWLMYPDRANTMPISARLGLNRKTILRKYLAIPSLRDRQTGRPPDGPLCEQWTSL